MLACDEVIPGAKADPANTDPSVVRGSCSGGLRLLGTVDKLSLFPSVRFRRLFSQTTRDWKFLETLLLRSRLSRDAGREEDDETKPSFLKCANEQGSRGRANRKRRTL
ncbi:hypothetical protein AAFF_G00030160 [Aldrovandia affinis]|uniref:Uncharacterized protein n=1 Tax=Aldrovandia affinis TaxID=143900 RepID=A0AAD7WGA6_9TELE|nr:hypothetical protein AAFF_G00030160 [Aldrovandia affinis]